MNLKVGDILEKIGNNDMEVLEVFEKIVAVRTIINSFCVYGIEWKQIIELEEQGWQLKKTEENKSVEVNFDHTTSLKISFCPACGTLEKKTRWLPGRKDVYWYMMDDGRITSKGWCCDYVDAGRYEIFNVFKTKEQAEAYRSELIERGKV